MRRVGEVLGLPVYEDSFCPQDNVYMIDSKTNLPMAQYSGVESGKLIIISPKIGLEFLLERQTMIDAISFFLTPGAGGIH